MSAATFDIRIGPIVVWARIEGPGGARNLRLAVDTVASYTLVNTARLVAVGYDPASAPDRVRIITGSGIEVVPRVAVSLIDCLDQSRADYPILAHTLPTA